MSQPIPTLDLLWFLLETQACPTHVGALLVFEKPAGAPNRFVADIVQAYRAERPTSPFDYVPDLSLPGWPRFRTAESYDPLHHVQHMSLPHGATYDDALRLVADLHESVLDRDRPLFRLWLIDGLPDHRFALYLKMHHSIVDGATVRQRIQASLGLKPQDRIGPAPFAVELPARKARTGTAAQDHWATLAAHAAQRAVTFADVCVRTLRSRVLERDAATGNRPFTATRAPMNQPIHRARSYATLTLAFDDVRAVAKHFEATLNDVAVAIVDAGVHRYLQQTGRAFEHRLVAMLPISLRDEGDTLGGTRASAMFSPLGEPRSAIEERLRQVKASIAVAKQELRSLTADSAMDYASAILGVAGLADALHAGRLVPPLANLVISNVPGERATGYLGRARVVGTFPISAIAAGVGLNVTLTSSDDRLDFGFVGDGQTMHDMAQLSTATREAFEELQASSRGERRRRRPASPKTRGTGTRSRTRRGSSASA